MKEKLRVSMSKTDAMAIARQGIRDASVLETLLSVIEQNSYPSSAKAAWVLRTAADLNIKKLGPYHQRVFELLKNSLHSGQRRDLTKILLEALKRKQLPEEQYGELMDYAFTCLSNAESATAEKYYSFEILMLFVPEYPELLSEISHITSIIAPGETSNFRRSCTKRLHEAKRKIISQS